LWRSGFFSDHLITYLPNARLEIKKKILVTGATGFVGQVLVTRLHELGYAVRAALHSPSSRFSTEDSLVVGDIDGGTSWQEALKSIECVVHLASRTHVTEEQSVDPLSAYRKINVTGTACLAKQALASGVRRFVFMSSIKVNGESTTNEPFRESSPPRPQDPYGISKLEAEHALHSVSNNMGMETVTLRPPLVYGPGVKGNLLRLLRMIDHGIPLPLASINNRRSFIGVHNLADAIVFAIEAQAAADQTYLISDGEDLSTPELIRKLSSLMGRHPGLWPCPAALLNFGATLICKREEASRLTGSLQVDSSRIRGELGWQPRHSLDQGLKAMVQWYHQMPN
jgi:nucleoside-diphosphate-sugar epimerase